MPNIPIYNQDPSQQQSPMMSPQQVPSVQAAPAQFAGNGFNAASMAKALGGSQGTDATNNLMTQSAPSTDQQWRQFLAQYGSSQPPAVQPPTSQMMPWQGGTFGTGGGGYGG